MDTQRKAEKGPRWQAVLAVKEGLLSRRLAARLPKVVDRAVELVALEPEVDKVVQLSQGTQIALELVVAQV